MTYVVNFLRANGIQKIYFNVVETPVSAPTDIWAATWFPPDSTAPYNTSPEDFGDVNAYTYVKPLIPILDCAGDGGYENSTATEFISGVNCGGTFRMDAIINKLKQLPQGKRAFILTRINQGPIYDEVADRFPGTTAQSPWAEAAGLTISSDLTTIFTRFGASGATPDQISIDQEQRGVFFSYQYTGSSAGFNARVFGITGSTYYTSTWYGMTSWQGIFTQNGKYNFNGSNIPTGNYHPQTNREYLLWDCANAAISTAFLNKFVVEPIKAIFPNVKTCNYEDFIISDGETLGNIYDNGGHPYIRQAIVGDAACPVLYAGWAFPDVYAVYGPDTTRLVRRDWQDGVTLANNSWTQTLFMLQVLRGAKRGAPNIPLRPWIGSPYFTDTSNNFFRSFWTDSTENFGLWKETVRHIALHDVETIYYFNQYEDTPAKRISGCTALNSVLTEVNTLLGGYRMGACVSTGRIDFLSDYILSGAGTTRGTYLWRVTPKPGFVLETDEKYPIYTDDDGGAWLETNTSTPPGLTLTAESRFVKLRKNDLTKRYYMYLFIANAVGITKAENLVFDGWGYGAKAVFMGKPDSGYGTHPRSSRAYPFEYDPVDPKISSPWHNVFYETFIENYAAGMRAVSVHFPWATAFSGSSAMNSWLLQPLDMLYGTTGFTFLYPRAGICGYTNGYSSTTEPEWCPARVKGFSGAVKQLLEGTMFPAGRTHISEACDVLIYTPSLDGWANYRTQKHIWWDYSAGTSAERDSALTARIDQYVDEFILPMKATTATGGILSIALDVGSYGANPEDIHLWRTMPDYRSDTCELASWYFRNKLRENNVYVYTEARGVTQHNRIDLQFTYPDGIRKTGNTGATASTQMTSIVGDENFFWFSDPELSTTGSFSQTLFRDSSYIKNRNIPAIHRLTGSYVTHGQRLPWRMSTETVYAGYTMEQFLANFADPNGSHYSYSMVYSPYWALSQIYAGADIYSDYLYRTATYENAIWGERRALKQFSTLAIDLSHMFAGWPQINQGRCAGIGGIGDTLSHDYTWWSPIDAPYVNLLPLFYGFGFTTSAESKHPFGYPTINYTGGFWTQAAKDWWNAEGNVRGRTFGALLNVFKDLSMRASPTGAPDPPYWIGPGALPTPYPLWGISDTYYLNGVDSTIR